MFDPVAFGEKMGAMMREAVAPLHKKIKSLEAQIEGAKNPEALIEDAVSKQIAALDMPKDGRDGVDGKDGLDGKDGEGFTIQEADELLQEKMARWELDFERRAAAALEKAIDRAPKPKDGVDGKDGIDGLGFDDMQAEYDGERGVTLKFARGDQVKSVSLRIPVVIDRGVYRANEGYEPGDGVTWGGSYWIAQQETKAKPDTPNSGWRLAVKKGRDGKDGRDGIDKTAAVKVKS